MAKQETGYRANIGSSSLILIFIVMCLVTFGMLSLSSAKSDWNLARRNADAVTEYYRADSEGEGFYAMVKEASADAWKKGKTEEERRLILESSLGQYYDGETGTASTRIMMERAQALSITLQLDIAGADHVDVNAWNVIQTENYEIDTSMPVWTGTQE